MPKHASKAIRFRYVRVTCDQPTHEFSYDGGRYRLDFEAAYFRKGEGALLTRTTGDTYPPLSSSLLGWLTLYLGEDAVEPNQVADPRYAHTRGTLPFDPATFDYFLTRSCRYPHPSHPLWRRRLFNRAVSYYVHGTRIGVYSMPITLGLFGLSLECVGNYDYGRRDKHFTLGNKRFRRLLHQSLAPWVRNPATSAQTRRFKYGVLEDVELLNQLRNAFYGHSLLHLDEDRRNVTTALRRWYERGGIEPAFARRTFRAARLENAIVSQFWPLYKVGLRTARLFLFLATRNRRIPFASHDFSILDDLAGAARQREPTPTRNS